MAIRKSLFQQRVARVLAVISIFLSHQSALTADVDIPNDAAFLDEEIEPFTLDDILLAEKDISEDAVPATKDKISPLIKNNSLIAQDEPPLGTPTGPTAPAAPTGSTAAAPVAAQKPKTILINFNNVTIAEYLRFVSKISGRNFVFDDNDLQFNVTIVSEEPTTIENIMTALLQTLRIHGLTMIEEGNNLIIHKTPGVNAISKVVSDSDQGSPRAEIVTRLFRLNTVDPDKAATIIRPLVSDSAIVEVFKDTNYVIVTDLSSNIAQIDQLLRSIDAPNSGLVIGQYVVKTGYIDSLIPIAQKIMQPISQDQPLIFVPHRALNSIFIVANPFLMERTLSILQYLDQTQGLTRIFDLKDLKFTPESPTGLQIPERLPEGAPRPSGWQLDSGGNWVFRPLQQPGIPAGGIPPQGQWFVDEQGNWKFQSGVQPLPPGSAGIGVGPEGQWRLDSQGIWVFQLAPGKSISPQRFARPEMGFAELPIGHIERTQFYIQKLYYRKGDALQSALGSIAQTLQISGTGNADLIAALNSVQWIQASNSLIFTGTADALSKVQELVEEIDTPLRQVFLEMLILETTIEDSLNFGVNWGTRFGGGDFSGSQAFLSVGSPLAIALDTTGIGRIPDASGLAVEPGFRQGIVGQHITHGGLEFSSLGWLVKAVHTDVNVRIIMNPNILTEDNYPGEIFVGLNLQFPTQAIANDRGTIITQNFEYRDVGTRLRVTPMIADNDMITLTIEEEDSSLVGPINAVGPSGPSTRRSYTKTRVHLPNGFFLVISGLLQDEDTVDNTSVPCLGGLPFIGSVFRDRFRRDQRRNLMLFVRPVIVDTEEEIDNLTKHEQDVFKYKSSMRKSWKYEVDEAMRFFNLPQPSDYPIAEDACEPCERGHND